MEIFDGVRVAEPLCPLGEAGRESDSLTKSDSEGRGKILLAIREAEGWFRAEDARARARGEDGVLVTDR